MHIPKKVGQALAVILLVSLVGAFGSTAAYLISQHNAKKVGLLEPNVEVGQTAPLRVCQAHGPCWMIYVTPHQANMVELEDEVSTYFLCAAFIFFCLLVAIGLVHRRSGGKLIR